MATLQSVLNDLHTLNNVAKITKDSCLNTKCSLFSGIIRELKALANVVGDVRIAIYHPRFKETPDHGKYLVELARIAKEAQTAIHDLAVGQLADFGNNKRESGTTRAEKAVNTRRLEENKSELANVSRSLRRLLDMMGGREDWSTFTPKEPVAETMIRSVSSRSAKPSSLPVDLGNLPQKARSVTNSPSPKPPPSPFQPMVEEVDDDPADEPQNVQTYHFVHPGDFAAKGKGRAMAEFVAPALFVRAPTDPITEDQIPSAVETPRDKHKAPLKSAMKKSSPTGSDGASNGPSPRSRPINDDSSSPLALAKTSSGGPADTDDLERRVQKLQAELAALRTPPSTSPNLDEERRAKRLSVDFGHTEEYVIREPRHPRQRAATTTGTERPAPFRFSSEGEVKRRTPRQSPREPSRDFAEASNSSRTKPSPRQTSRGYERSPRVPPSPTFRQPEQLDSYGDPSRYYAMWGTDPRTSLPTVLEGPRPADTSARRTPRASPRPPSLDQAYGDFFRSSGGGKTDDFELFGPSEAARVESSHTSPRQNSDRQPSVPREDSWTPVLEHELAVSLEHLYAGTTMKAQIHRKIDDPMTGRFQQQEHSVTIVIPPGLKAGSKIKFKGAGDVTANGSQDIHFVIKESPHALYTRHSADLHTSLDIPLVDSLLGWSRTLRTICGKQIKISHPGPTPPSWQGSYAGLGMCERHQPDTRGDLIVGVKVVWPAKLTDRQKRLLAECFEGN